MTDMQRMEMISHNVVLNFRAEEVGLLSDDSSLTNIPVQLFDTGHVYWLAPANFEANCEINIQYYPFDKQSCKMTVSLGRSCTKLTTPLINKT